MITLNINKKSYNVDVDPDMPLLWVLRDDLGLWEPNMAAAWHNVAPALFTLMAKRFVPVLQK